MFIRLVCSAKEDAIVTGDDDLLTLASDSRIPIRAPAAFGKLSGL